MWIILNTRETFWIVLRYENEFVNLNDYNHQFTGIAFSFSIHWFTIVHLSYGTSFSCKIFNISRLLRYMNLAIITVYLFSRLCVCWFSLQRDKYEEVMKNLVRSAQPLNHSSSPCDAEFVPITQVSLSYFTFSHTSFQHLSAFQ